MYCKKAHTVKKFDQNNKEKNKEVASIMPKKLSSEKRNPEKIHNVPDESYMSKLAIRLFEHYSDRLIAKARVLIASYPKVPIDEHDLLNAIWEKFYKSVTQFDPTKNDNIEAYIFYINNFAMRDVLREYLGKKHQPLNESIPFCELMDSPSQEEFLTNIDYLETKLGQMIHAVLNPEKLWEIYIFFFIEKRKKVEISFQLQINYYELNKKIKRIRFLLQSKIKPKLLEEQRLENQDP